MALAEVSKGDGPRGKRDRIRERGRRLFRVPTRLSVWKRLKTFVSIAIFVSLWWLASATGIFGAYPPELAQLVLPPPNVILETGVDLTRTGELQHHLLVSVVRVLQGFTLAAVIGISLGTAMGLSRSVHDWIEPIVKLLQPIPGIAWIPLAIIWFGLGNKAALFIIVMGSLFPLLFNTVQAFQDLSPVLVNAARTLGASRSQVLIKVALPAAVPYLITGARIGIGYAWRALVAAELVGIPSGLGFLLSQGRGVGRTDIVILVMASLAVCMLIVERGVFGVLEKKTQAWRIP